MPKVRNPLFSAAARGRMGDIVFTHGPGSEPQVRIFTKPANPRTALQQAQREKFATAQGMYLRGYDDYDSVTNATGKNLVLDYLANVSAFKQENPVPPKSFANGFESGRVLQRAYAIRHSLKNNLLVRRLINGQIKNVSGGALNILCFKADGFSLPHVALANGAAAALPANTVLISVTKAPINPGEIEAIDTLGLKFGNNTTELIRPDTMQMFTA